MRALLALMVFAGVAQAQPGTRLQSEAQMAGRFVEVSEPKPNTVDSTEYRFDRSGKLTLQVTRVDPGQGKLRVRRATSTHSWYFVDGVGGNAGVRLLCVRYSGDPEPSCFVPYLYERAGETYIRWGPFRLTKLQ